MSKITIHISLVAAFLCFLSSGEAVQAESPKVTWAIAIHGGAGGNIKRDQDKKDAKIAGLNKALDVGKTVLAKGGTALEAVEAVINTLEDNPNFNAGRGAVRTKDGKAELDASIMDGRTLQCGGVAGVTIVKNPISLARKVMSETKHVLLAGSGADEFARQQKMPIVNPNYFLSSLPAKDHLYLGTVGCVALDQDGNLAAGTSTGGTSNKLAGRIGDSPIIGAGTYAANGLCAVSGTGIGEEYIRNAVAYDVAAQMKYSGTSLPDAVTKVMTQTLKKNVGGLICVGQDGQIVLQHNTGGMSCGAADSNGRFETFVRLPEGERSDQTASQTDVVSDNDMIRGLLNQQVKDWNNGDIDSFMNVYWKSEDLTFSSSGKTTRGWTATLDGYKSRYPDRQTMGKLSFSMLEFERLDKNAIQVLGTWKLKRESDPISGRFTLILRQIGGQWRIVHDHTSALKK